MKKFTLGPWHGGSPCGTGELDSVKQHEGKLRQEHSDIHAAQPDGTINRVVHVYQGNGDVGSPRALGEQLANAQLIAAAPCMFKTLKVVEYVLAAQNACIRRALQVLDSHEVRSALHQQAIANNAVKTTMAMASRADVVA